MKSMTVSVVVRGITPLLVHKFATEAEVGSASRRVKTTTVDPRTEAEKATLRDREGYCCISGFSIPGCMGGAGSGHKVKGSRKSLRFVVPSAIMIKDEAIRILDSDGKPTKDFEVDARPVTIPATKGRIMRFRPRWNSWKLKFDIEVDTDMLGLDDAQMLLQEGGQSYGIGDFRPEKRGPFGRFVIESWKSS